jgi:hypothetical protein
MKGFLLVACVYEIKIPPYLRSSWWLFLVRNEHNQDPPSCPLLVPSKVWLKLELLQYLIISLCQTYNKIFYLSLNKLVMIYSPILPYSPRGIWLSPYLGLLRGRTIYRVTLTHSLLNLSSGSSFFKRFCKENIDPQMILSNCSMCLIRYQGIVLPLFLLLLQRFMWSSWEGEWEGILASKYFAKWKTGPKRVRTSYNLDQEVHVCGMWMVGGKENMETLSCMLSLLYFILDMAIFLFLDLHVSTYFFSILGPHVSNFFIFLFA